MFMPLVFVSTQTPYQIRLPKPSFVEGTLDQISNAFTDLSPLVSLCGVMGAFGFCLFKYGEATVYLVSQ